MPFIEKVGVELLDEESPDEELTGNEVAGAAVVVREVKLEKDVGAAEI